MALELFGKKFLDAASKLYKASLATELNKMGAYIAIPVHNFFMRRESRGAESPNIIASPFAGGVVASGSVV